MLARRDTSVSFARYSWVLMRAETIWFECARSQVLITVILAKNIAATLARAVLCPKGTSRSKNRQQVIILMPVLYVDQGVCAP